TYTYLDDGIDRYAADGVNTIEMQVDTNYCYKVETFGAYGRLPQFGTLRNFSQVMCSSPIDNTPPCPPELSIDDLNCENLDREAICETNTLSNKLSWKTPASSGGLLCRSDIIRYNIYFARYKEDTPKLLAAIDKPVPPETSFTHTRSVQDGFAGCYYITAVNSLNIESSASATICKDNCATVLLPNVFTPNGDGKNDTFTPMTCSAFIQNIDIEIYNRYGLKVYQSGSSNILSWDGRSSSGVELPSGTYYYLAKVSLQRLDRKDETPTTIKGWVELIR
ncbi:gliding motility-associated C-terminal domain-containing protein, partial [Emticicia agri]